jgi:hypothetical protein
MRNKSKGTLDKRAKDNEALRNELSEACAAADTANEYPERRHF